MLNRLGESPDALYELARVAARGAQAEKARTVLGRSIAAAPEAEREAWWKRAAADPLFRTLAERDQAFGDFLKNKGAAPAPNTDAPKSDVPTSDVPGTDKTKTDAPGTDKPKANPGTEPGKTAPAGTNPVKPAPAKTEPKPAPAS